MLELALRQKQEFDKTHPQAVASLSGDYSEEVSGLEIQLVFRNGDQILEERKWDFREESFQIVASRSEVRAKIKKALLFITQKASETYDELRRAFDAHEWGIYEKGYGNEIDSLSERLAQRLAYGLFPPDHTMTVGDIREVTEFLTGIVELLAKILKKAGEIKKEVSHIQQAQNHLQQALALIDRLEFAQEQSDSIDMGTETSVSSEGSSLPFFHKSAEVLREIKRRVTQGKFIRLTTTKLGLGKKIGKKLRQKKVEIREEPDLIKEIDGLSLETIRQVVTDVKKMEQQYGDFGLTIMPSLHYEIHERIQPSYVQDRRERDSSYVRAGRRPFQITVTPPQSRSEVRIQKQAEGGRPSAVESPVSDLTAVNLAPVSNLRDQNTVTFPVENDAIVSNLKTVSGDRASYNAFRKDQGIGLGKVMFDFTQDSLLEISGKFQEHLLRLAGKIIWGHFKPDFFLTNPPATRPEALERSSDSKNSGEDTSISSSISERIRGSKTMPSVRPLLSTSRTIPSKAKGSFRRPNTTTFSSDNPFKSDISLPPDKPKYTTFSPQGRKPKSAVARSEASQKEGKQVRLLARQVVGEPANESVEGSIPSLSDPGLSALDLSKAPEALRRRSEEVRRIEQTTRQSFGVERVVADFNRIQGSDGKLRELIYTAAVQGRQVIVYNVNTTDPVGKLLSNDPKLKGRLITESGGLAEAFRKYLTGDQGKVVVLSDKASPAEAALLRSELRKAGIDEDRTYLLADEVGQAGTVGAGLEAVSFYGKYKDLPPYAAFDNQRRVVIIRRSVTDSWRDRYERTVAFARAA